MDRAKKLAQKPLKGKKDQGVSCKHMMWSYERGTNPRPSRIEGRDHQSDSFPLGRKQV